MAEYWHADTLEIAAKVMRTDLTATAEDSPEARLVLGGADVTTSAGGAAGLKYFNSGYQTAMHQARPLENLYQAYLKEHPGTTREEFLSTKHLDPNTDFTLSLYEGQARICPADQLDDVKKALERKISDLKNNLDNPERAKYARAYEETLAQINDHLEGPNGEKSLPLTYEQSRQLMQCAKEGKFDPKDFDVDAAKLADKSFLLMNSLDAGLSSAMITAVLSVAPQIVNLIKQSVIDGEIDVDDLNSIGTNGASAAAEGFIRGSVLSCITTASEMGYLGDSIKAASKAPNFSAGIATAVSLMIAISKETISYSHGTIDKLAYEQNVERAVFVACTSYGIGSGIQAMCPALPYIGYMIGSFVGSVLGGLAFEVKEEFLMSLCAHNGYTLWGLVEQDYTLPKEVSERLGYKLMERANVKNADFFRYSVKPAHFRRETFNYSRLDYTPSVRGIVGVRKIAYVQA